MLSARARCSRVRCSRVRCSNARSGSVKLKCSVLVLSTEHQMLEHCSLLTIELRCVYTRRYSSHIACDIRRCNLLHRVNGKLQWWTSHETHRVGVGLFSTFATKLQQLSIWLDVKILLSEHSLTQNLKVN